MTTFDEAECLKTNPFEGDFGSPSDKVLKDKTKRTVAKPGVLGCGYMLSAGHEFENERTGEIEATGLLGYAWNMGVKLTLEQSAQSVDVFRDTYIEVPEYWDEIDQAARRFDLLPAPGNMPEPLGDEEDDESSIGLARARGFGATQLLTQHRGLWDLLEARASARRG